MSADDSDVTRLLRILADKKNVIISGPPATGKTRLMTLAREEFENPGHVVLDPNGPAAFPSESHGINARFPWSNCSERKVFPITFHQGTRYRDFVRGLVPKPGDTVCFKVSEGVLYQAAQFARQDSHAAIVMIDEINRGPAVEIFGDMITAIESDKRLSGDGKPVRGKTVTTRILDDDANLVDWQLPDRLYFLAAMNKADSSVEPLDVAFLRRWEPYEISPNEHSLEAFFGLDPDDGRDLPESPQTAGDVYRAAVRAWKAVNEKLALGRGGEFQIGQGVLMHPSEQAPTDLHSSLRYVADCWPKIRAHIDEVFYGDVKAVAEVLNAQTSDFYTLVENVFADRQVLHIEESQLVTSDNIYELLLTVAG